MLQQRKNNINLILELSRQIDTKEIKHNLENFERVKEEIKEINPENLTVFMESTGTYHLSVERYFKGLFN